MKSFAKIIVVSLVLLGFTTISPPIGAIPSSNRSPIPAMTTLVGQEAQQFVLNLSWRLKNRFKAAQRRSKARLTGRGLSKTSIVTVQLRRRTRPFEKPASSLYRQLANLAVTRLVAQEDYSTEEMFTVITSWDDNDPNTWEGNIFAYDYATNMSVNLDTQVDISFPETNTNPDPTAVDAVDATPVNYATGDIVEDDGGGDDGDGDPIPVKDNFVELPTIAKASLGTLTALMAGECSCSKLQVSDPADNMAKCMVVNGVKNAVSSIVGTSVAAGFFARCRATGPAYFGCVGVGAVASIVKNLWDQGADVMHRCTVPLPNPTTRQHSMPFTRQER